MLGFDSIGSATLIAYDGEPVLTTHAWINEDAYFGSWGHDYAIPGAQMDAIKRAKFHWFSHGHPDHCSDLNPLLRARSMAERPAPPLPVYAPPGALDAVLALDRPGVLDDSFDLREFAPGAAFDTGPFAVRSWLLPHWQVNAGLRLRAGGTVLAYTGDTGPSPDLPALARDADVFVAEASYPEQVPGDSVRYLSSALQAGQTAAAAGARRLLLTHLMPGTDPGAAIGAAAAGYDGDIAVAVPGWRLT